MLDHIPLGYATYILIVGVLGAFGAFKIYYWMADSISSGTWIILNWMFLIPIGFIVFSLAEKIHLYYGMIYVAPVVPFILIGALLGADTAVNPRK